MRFRDHHTDADDDHHAFQQWQRHLRDITPIEYWAYTNFSERAYEQATASSPSDSHDDDDQTEQEPADEPADAHD